MQSALCLFILPVVLISDGMAAKAKWTPPPPTRGKIVRVDIANLSVTIQLNVKGSPHTYPLVPECTIEINGYVKKLQDLKPGLFIRSLRLDFSTPASLEDLDVVSDDKH
jgi:hypothetical protein